MHPVKIELMGGPHDGLFIDLTDAIPELRLPCHAHPKPCLSAALSIQITPAIRCWVYRRGRWDMYKQRWSYHYVGATE